jgi:hypothetical protein
VVTVTVVACVAFGLLIVPALAAAASWIPAVNLATPSEFSPWEPRPEIAVSGAGGGVAIWPQLKGTQDVEVANMSATGTWGVPVKLAPSIYTQRNAQVAMNEAGEAVAVWEQVGEQVAVVASVRAPSGEWGPPETLNPEGSVYGGIDVSVGPAGEAVAVWSEDPRFISTSGYRVEGSFRPAGGHWEPSVTISETGHNSWSPQVAIAPSGQIVATWYGYYDGNSGRTVQVAESQGGDWSQPQALSSEHSSWFPKLEVSTAGATVIWESEEGWIEAASRTAGGEWGEPVELSGPESIEPQIGADAAGNAIAVWTSGYGEEGEYIESSTLPAGGTWSEPTEISGPLLVESTEPRLAVAPNGETLATWSTWHDKEPFVEEERFVEAASGVEGEWEEPTTLSPVGAWAVRAAVALDGQGDGVVAWWAGNPTLPQATEFVAPRPSVGSAGAEPPHSSGRPPASGPKKAHGTVPRATARRVAFVKANKAFVKLYCGGARACKGDLRLIAPTAGRKASVSTDSVNFTIPAGDEETIVTELTPTCRRLLSAAGTIGLPVRLVGDGVRGRGLMIIKPGNGRPRSH